MSAPFAVPSSIVSLCEDLAEEERTDYKELVERVAARFPEAIAWYRSLKGGARRPILEAFRAQEQVEVDRVDPERYFPWLAEVHRALGAPAPLERFQTPESPRRLPRFDVPKLIDDLGRCRRGGRVLLEVDRHGVARRWFLIPHGLELVDVGELPHRRDRTDEDLGQLGVALAEVIS